MIPGGLCRRSRRYLVAVEYCSPVLQCRLVLFKSFRLLLSLCYAFASYLHVVRHKFEQQWCAKCLCGCTWIACLSDIGYWLDRMIWKNSTPWWTLPILVYLVLLRTFARHIKRRSWQVRRIRFRHS
jgi:hypothetical protein